MEAQRNPRGRSFADCLWGRGGLLRFRVS